MKSEPEVCQSSEQNTEKADYEGRDIRSLYEQEAVRFVASLRLAEKALRPFEGQAIRRHHLTPPQFAILDVLYFNPNSSVQFILDHALNTSGNTAVILANLDKMGLIVQKSDPHDRRCKRISLTDQGRVLFEEVFPEHAGMMMELFSDFDPEKLREMRQMMNELQEYLIDQKKKTNHELPDF